MNVCHLPYGKGDVKSAINYLFALKDHKGKDRAEVKILHGDSIQICQLCSDIKTLKKYSSTVIPFAKEDGPTLEEITEILSDWESLAFAGLALSSFTYLAVLHVDEDGSWHVHIVTPSIHITTGKAYNVAPPGWQRDYQALRNYWNFKLGMARPDHPARARLVSGGSLTKGFTWRKGSNSRQLIAQEITEHVVASRIRNREDVITHLAQKGLVTNVGNSSICFRSEGSTTVKLSGLLFQADWRIDAIKEAYVRDRTGLGRGRDAPNLELAAHWKAILEERIARKLAYNQSRYVTRRSSAIEIVTDKVAKQPSAAAMNSDLRPRTHFSNPDAELEGKLKKSDVDYFELEHPTASNGIRWLKFSEANHERAPETERAEHYSELVGRALSRADLYARAAYAASIGTSNEVDEAIGSAVKSTSRAASISAATHESALHAIEDVDCFLRTASRRISDAINGTIEAIDHDRHVLIRSFVHPIVKNAASIQLVEQEISKSVAGSILDDSEKEHFERRVLNFVREKRIAWSKEPLFKLERMLQNSISAPQKSAVESLGHWAIQLELRRLIYRRKADQPKVLSSEVTKYEPELWQLEEARYTEETNDGRPEG